MTYTRHGYIERTIDADAITQTLVGVINDYRRPPHEHFDSSHLDEILEDERFPSFAYSIEYKATELDEYGQGDMDSGPYDATEAVQCWLCEVASMFNATAAEIILLDKAAYDAISDDCDAWNGELPDEDQEYVDCKVIFKNKEL